MLEKLCNLFCGNSGSDDAVEAIRHVLSGDSVGIISAQCCSPLAAENDPALETNVREAMQSMDLEPSYRVISITDAQKALPKLKDELSPAKQRLVMQVQGLVSSEGFSVFPMLFIGGNIAYYGGLPTTDMIAEKLTTMASARNMTVETGVATS